MAQPTARELMRAILLTNNGIGNGRTTGGGGAADHARSRNLSHFLKTPLGRLYGSDPAAQMQMFENQYYGGGAAMKYGQAPNERDMDRWLDRATAGLQPQGRTGGPPMVGQQSPMNPTAQAFLDQQRQQGGGMSGGQGGLGGMPGDQINTLLMLTAMRDEAARNAAVKARETEIRGGMDDLYGRVMGRVDNYGKAEAENIKERMAESQRNGEARRSARGLGNSTINESFRQRGARDEARLLQQLSEDVDDRHIRYDTDLSRDKNQFVERIVDRGPDMSQIINLAQQLGLNGGGQLAGAGQRGVTNSAAQQLLGGGAGGGAGSQPVDRNQPIMTPWGPLQYASPYGGQFRQPINANPILADPRNPMAAIIGQRDLVNQFVPQPQVRGSDLYPKPQSPEFYGMLQNAIQQNTAANQGRARVRNVKSRQRKAWEGMNRPYYRHSNVDYIA